MCLNLRRDRYSKPYYRKAKNFYGYKVMLKDECGNFYSPIYNTRKSHVLGDTYPALDYTAPGYNLLRNRSIRDKKDFGYHILVNLKDAKKVCKEYTTSHIFRYPLHVVKVQMFGFIASGTYYIFDSATYKSETWQKIKILKAVK